jgi:hypothetical protein
MHATLQLLLFWALAFVTLCSAVALLNIFYGVIENDLELHTLGKEAAIAEVASLVEGGSVWLVIFLVPGAQRALILPLLIVALIYKIAHFEDWRNGDVFMLLMFQVVIGSSGSLLFAGHFGQASFVLAGFGIILAVIAAFARTL